MFQMIGTLLAVATLMWVVVTKPVQLGQGCGGKSASAGVCTASNSR